MKYPRQLCVLAAAAFVAFNAGCSSDQWVEFEHISSAPPSVLINQDRIEIPAGLAVGVRATAIEDGDPVETELDLVPVHAGVIAIERALEDGEWVIWGISPGATSVELHFGRDVVGEMSAVVTEQHATAD